MRRRASRRLPPGISALVQGVRIFKAGNSLAVRIPSLVAKKLDLQDGCEVEMHLDDGALWIVPAAGRRESLAQLLKKVTPDNLHGEIATGPARGREVLDD
ncbi:MAG: AbrB/MazE/SpoVT family DNA-binding domain-containing protein [Candidatus Eremiobacteraeota bacterium]|nr:AbrB/MazE/SpoVT family DNA-binding domain-containing protein [Candidatus Eremiobacteraeota bacterium]MBV8355065.1 AbrB/MazE/SpoVT family DNA-binding domain-containing protein [Candidatus Eremiobacteraeota bacterium]